jgi:hypothetical protein
MRPQMPKSFPVSGPETGTCLSGHCGLETAARRSCWGTLSVQGPDSQVDWNTAQLGPHIPAKDASVTERGSWYSRKTRDLPKEPQVAECDTIQGTDSCESSICPSKQAPQKHERRPVLTNISAGPIRTNNHAHRIAPASTYLVLSLILTCVAWIPPGASITVRLTNQLNSSVRRKQFWTSFVRVFLQNLT